MDVDGGQNQSFICCNGKKLATFTSFSSLGSTQMTFGDLNPSGSGTAPLKRDIALFLLYQNSITQYICIQLILMCLRILAMIKLKS